MATLEPSLSEEIVVLKTQVRLLTDAYNRLNQEVKQLRILIQNPE